MSARTALYRHWDSNGKLLYVGISLSAVTRLAQHKAGSHWSDAIDKVTIEYFDSREAALIAEKDAIKSERPMHNRVYNTFPKATNDNGKRGCRQRERDPARLEAAIDAARKLFYRWVDDETGLSAEELEALYRTAPELAFTRRRGIIDPSPSDLVHLMLEDQIGWHSNDDWRIRAVA